MSLPVNFSEVTHKWLGDARDPFPRRQDHLLCLVKQGDVTEFPCPVNVALYNEDVTCKECLELIHS